MVGTFGGWDDNCVIDDFPTFGCSLFGNCDNCDIDYFLPLAVPCLEIVIIDDFLTFGCELFGCSLSRAAFTAPVTREI